MKVRFCDLSVRDQSIKANLLEAVSRVLDHGQLILGQEVEQFETLFARRCDMAYCVGVGSGTAALYLSLRALDIGPNDEVITTPLSWISTLQAIVACGATPRFADIGNDLNLMAGHVEDLIGPKTKAILPVHFTGRLCDMPALSKIAAQYNLHIIEDAAQAFGADRKGTKVGRLSTMSAFSLNPMKNPSAFGEAGAIVTNSKKIRDRLRRLRHVGMEMGEVCLEPSLNFKMDALQAAMVGVSLNRAEEVIKRRLAVAQKYTEALSGVVTCPSAKKGRDRPSVFFDYTIITEQRDALKDHLEGRGIEVKIKHSPLMPDQPAFKGFVEADVPNARRLVSQILSLPVHEKLTDAEIDYVIAEIRNFFST